MLDSAAAIRKCAEELIASLGNLPDASGDAWTQENFRRLDAFAIQKNPALKSFYCKHLKRTEFLWDFISAAPEIGIFIAAESEQAVADDAQVQALKHDFEKLLYVYSPIRLLITKARNFEHAKHLTEVLSAYAKDCCLMFNPGAVFILHFGLWGNAGNVAYLWQSEGEPRDRKCEPLLFEQVKPTSTTQ